YRERGVSTRDRGGIPPSRSAVLAADPKRSMLGLATHGHKLTPAPFGRVRIEQTSWPAEGEYVMDPITAAIMAVLPALASDAVKTGVKDAYDGLKAVIRRKWGESAPIAKAIAAVEEDPTSKAQAAVLEE